MNSYKNSFRHFSGSVRLTKLKSFSKNKKTPFLILDTDRVKKNYRTLSKSLKRAKIFYAVKANPHEKVLKVLASEGSNFDVASKDELELLLKLKIKPERISFGNTIKKDEDITYFYKKGVRLFATDSINDLKKIAKNAKGSKVYFRLLVDGLWSDWPLSKKFGAHSDVILKLAKEAKKLGVVPYGLSFHVGSQQRDVMQWDQAISQCRYIFEELENIGIKLEMLNLGGGFPSEYLVPTNDIRYYCKKIDSYLKTHFNNNLPTIYVEPGRFLVGNAGIIVSEVVLISKKSDSLNHEWMYIDAGIYQGLDECAGEAIKYPILTDAKGSNEKSFVLAGPTCDSQDILYESERYSFPSSIKENDRLYFLSTGAYTYQLSAVSFNGFPPLKVYVVKNLL